MRWLGAEACRLRFLWLLLLGLLGCDASGPKFQALDITGAEYARALSLIDPAGRTRTLREFRGKAIAVLFGYTQCPDVCPTTLSNMARVMELLGPEAARVQVLFVTVDPERDLAVLLGEYVPAFHPSFIGLRGEAEQTQAVQREFRVLVQKHGDVKAGNYSVDHSTGSYLFDPRGRIRLLVPYGEKPESIVADLRLLLGGR